ncbi:uncharacterized protein LOC134534245 isoform X2 [Bacillus rossius redtenbacheri]
MEALTGALISLYETADRPPDPLAYVGEKLLERFREKFENAKRTLACNLECARTLEARHRRLLKRLEYLQRRDMECHGQEGEVADSAEEDVYLADTLRDETPDRDAEILGRALGAQDARPPEDAGTVPRGHPVQNIMDQTLEDIDGAEVLVPVHVFTVNDLTFLQKDVIFSEIANLCAYAKEL